MKLTRREFLQTCGLASAALLLPSWAERASVAQPLFQNNKPRLRDLAEKLNIEIGVSLREIDRWKLVKFPAYLEAIKQFALIKDGYTVSADSWMNNLNTYEYLTQLGHFAQQNKMGLSIDNLFYWNWFLPGAKAASLANATKEQMDVFLKDMVRKHFQVPYFTDLTFASEATGSDQDDVVHWNENYPMLRLYGEDWPEMAYHLAWDEAQKTNRKVGEQVSFLYVVSGQVEVPNSRHADYEYKHLTELKAKLSADLGIQRPFAVGMEYHVHHGPVANPENGCWGPAVGSLKKDQLIEHFRRFNEIGDMMINECSITGTDDPGLKKETLHILLEAAIESKAVKRILFWTPFFQPTGDAHNDAYDLTCNQAGLFTSDYTPDYLFEEMGKIFTSYG